MRDLITLKRMIYQIYYILNKKQRAQMFWVLGVILVGSLFELLGVSSMLPLVQSIIEPEKLFAKPYIRLLCDFFRVNSSQGVVILVCIGIILIYFVKNLYLSFSAYIQSVYNGRIMRDVAILMLRSYIQRPYSFFVETSMDVIMRGVQVDSDCVSGVIQSGFKLLSELFVIGVVSVFLMSTDITLTIGVLIVGVACMFIIVIGFKKKISALASITHSAAGEQYKWISQITGGIKDIMVYNRQRYFISSFEKAADDSSTALTKYNFVSALPERVIEFFCVAGIVLAVLFRVLFGVDTVSFVSNLAVFAMGAFRILPSISRCTGYINQFVYYRKYIEVAYKNIEEARRITPEKERYFWEIAPSSEDNKRFNKCISVDHICWRYPRSDRDVLNGVSLDIKKGQAIGIIGESGSGKSTLSDILLGLYQPYKGEIRMDGENIEYIPASWSRNIGYVPQAVYLLDDTVRENIVFGADDCDDEKVWKALRKASLYDFVKDLPNGIDTVVGERGIKFSGGQRQRIAIARALYSEPQILILDEATSALDSDTEKSVMDEINLLTGDITMIIIAHRVSTLKNCDIIFEIKDGKAVIRDKNEVIGHQ